MEVICTICSKNKKTDNYSIPAYQRYTSKRISLVKKISDQKELPFFILSGKFGFISALKKIPWYDHLLKDDEIDVLTRKVEDQIKTLKITKIYFFAKSRKTPNWGTYYQTIEKAVSSTKTKLVINLIN